MIKKIHPPTGTNIVCQNWQIEAVYRMIQHNLCSEVAEKPSETMIAVSSNNLSSVVVMVIPFLRVAKVIYN